jgi:hypothetical protein
MMAKSREFGGFGAQLKQLVQAQGFELSPVSANLR